jgi:hypothetical protein
MNSAHDAVVPLLTTHHRVVAIPSMSTTLPVVEPVEVPSQACQAVDWQHFGVA